MDWLLGAAALVGLIGLLYWGMVWFRSEDTSSVIEVRTTPRREVEEMTVDEFRELGVEYLLEQGYRFEDPPTDRVVAVLEEERYWVHFDPAARAENPRRINELIVEQRKSDVSGIILVTSGELTDQSEALARRAEIEVLDPGRLIGWRREGVDPGG